LSLSNPSALETQPPGGCDGKTPHKKPTPRVVEVEAAKVVERMNKGEASLWEVAGCALNLGARETMAATASVGITGPDAVIERRAAGYNEGDKVGVLLDLNEGSLSFFKNGRKHGCGEWGPKVQPLPQI
jgi:hypothetical protein